MTNQDDRTTRWLTDGPVSARAANGGTIGSAGTFRVSDYSPDGGATFKPITLNGSVTSVPEPCSIILGGIGGVSLCQCDPPSSARLSGLVAESSPSEARRRWRFGTPLRTTAGRATLNSRPIGRSTTGVLRSRGGAAWPG